ncbi:MAG TPA: ATP synthase F1 subunit epsilon [Bryobacteraceae bacterium]|nr:ATP synthase F1 subunit epsilon [Bryobacteraceae bacterium]
MAATFELEVATPDRLLVKDQVTEAQIPALNGYLGILPDHAPLLSELGSGLLTYVIGGKTNSVVISGGWVEVLPTGTRVLAATAERPDEIDLKRAKESLDRAERRLKEAGDWDIARALRAAERARARMEAASKTGR